MTRLEALQELAEKVEAGDEKWVHLPRTFDLRTDLVWKAWSGSLDAANSLHDAVLPGWTVRISAYTTHGNSPPHVHVFKMRMTEDDPTLSANSIGYKGDNPARAWLLAILKALIAREQAKGDE